MSAGAGRAMGLDVGERRVGVAIADELGLIASPLAVVRRGPGDLQEIRDLARDHGIDRLILGMPTGLSGREGPQAASVRTFADDLEAVTAGEPPIEFWDERLTTAIAERALRGQRKRRKRQSGEVDAMAAAVILQGYLDAHRSRSRPKAAPHEDEAG